MQPTTKTDTESNTLPQMRKDLDITTIGKDYVIYDARSKRVHVLNSTSHFVFQHCDGSTTVADLVDLMTKKFSGATEDRLRVDIRRIIEGFHDESLLET